MTIPRDRLVPGDSKNRWHPHGYHVECLRREGLVYVRTLKAASEFFWRNLSANGWVAIQFNDINWEHDHVFSYLLDPIERRHKGVAERLSGDVGLHLFDDPAFCNIVAQLPMLDEHSASLDSIYREYLRQIDWIPLTQEPQDAAAWTNRLLAHYGYNPIKWIWNYAHTSHPAKHHAYLIIKQLWDRPDSINPAVRTYFEKDMLLYLDVLNKFRASSTTWPETSWLRND